MKYQEFFKRSVCTHNKYVSFQVEFKYSRKILRISSAYFR